MEFGDLDDFFLSGRIIEDGYNASPLRCAPLFIWVIVIAFLDILRTKRATSLG